MKSRSAATALLAALLATLSLQALAKEPKKKPLEYYAPLWTASPLTTTPVQIDPAPATDPAVTERQARAAEFRKMQERIRILEIEVRNLKAALRKGDPAPRPQTLTKDKFVPSQWLLDHEPEPGSVEVAELQLEGFTNREAQRCGLTVKRRKLLTRVKGQRYGRARIQIEVTGGEQHLYQWLHLLHSPKDFRGVTRLRILPKRDDDTQVECLVVVESWVLPEGGAGRGRFENDPTSELRPLLESDHDPMELLLQVARPLNGTAGRLKFIEVVNALQNNQLEQKAHLLRQIRLGGLSLNLATVTNYTIALKESPGLKSYKWTTPPPNEHPKTGRWLFHFDAHFEGP